MTFITILIVGFLAGLAARSIFPRGRWGGLTGLVTLSVAGSALGGVASMLLHPAGQRLIFLPLDVWLSTLGAVMAVAVSAVIRRADLAQVLPGLERQEAK